MMICRSFRLGVMATLGASVLTFMVMHLGFTTAMLVAAARYNQRLILFGIHFRQLIEERDHAPNILVAHALAPGRHAGGFNAVLDHPERGGWIAINTNLGQVRRSGIQGLAKLCFRNTWGQVATDAHGVVITCTGSNKSLVIEIWHLDVPGAHFDRAVTGHRQKGMHSREVRIIGTHVDQAEISTGTYCYTTDDARRHYGFNCSFHVRLSKPHPNTGNQACLFNIPALIAH